MANSIYSIHALVRLLKSPTDPPAASGPSKIEIACLAWSDSTFHAANKGEVIGEFILTVLGQAKKTSRQKLADSVSDPIADPKYWTLLSDVLTRPPVATARPIKTWLLPLLNRFQFDAIVTELLVLQSSQVLAPARLALTVLWPLAEKKISVDALGECLGAVFEACSHWERVDDNLSWVCLAVVGAYRNSLANAGNKKKFYSSFLSTRLTGWLNVVCVAPPLASPSSAKSLEDSIYAAGVDTIFSLDALKQPLGTLFDAFSSVQSPISSHLFLFPRLFTSFLNAVHRNRSALFVTTTGITGGKEEVRKLGMEFVKRCWILIRESASLHEVEKWRSITGVFWIVEKERLFIPYTIRGTRIDATNSECGGELALSQARDKAVETLDTVTVSKDHQQAIASIQLLDVLVRIEYDFIGSILERVLSALINMPSSIFSPVLTPCSEFLNQVLQYHTKTRTVHTYTLALLSTVASSDHFASRAPSPSDTSIFPLAYHLPVLARALRTSLTPTQTTPLAIAALQAVERTWMAIVDADQAGRAIKKRRIMEDTDESEREAPTIPVLVRAFSFTSRIAGTVLSNFPLNAYTEDGDESLKILWEDVGKLGWAIVWNCLREKAGGRQRAKGSHDKKRKHEVEAHALSTRFHHIVASATLRFLYDVRARISCPLGEYDELGEPDVETLLDVLQDAASDPDLVLETIRTLFWHICHTHSCRSQRKIEMQPILAATLDIVTTRVSLRSKWSGMLADLNSDNLSLAILYVLTDRWIDIIDALGSPEGLEKLISLLFAMPLDVLDDISGKPDESHPQGERAVITFRVLLLRLLQNAHFWELHNIRAILLSYVLRLTAPLSLSYCFSADDVKLPLPAAAAQAELSHACDVYRLLGYVPPEYFTRSVRGELIKRAIDGDAQICAVLASANEQGDEVAKIGVSIGNAESRRSHTDEPDERLSAKDWYRRLTFVRVFLQRMGQFLNATNQTTSLVFVNRLLSSPCTSSPPKALTDVTLDLIQLHILSLLRSQATEAGASISSIVSAFIAAGQPNSRETWTYAVIQPSVLKLIEQLTSDFDLASLPDEVKRSLKTLCDALESALLPHVQRSVTNEVAEFYRSFPSEQISAWSRVLSLRRWLGIHSPAVSPPFGQRLAISVIRSGTSKNPTTLDSETCSSILRLLFEELWCMPDVPHRAHLDVLVGFYVANGYWDFGSLSFPPVTPSCASRVPEVESTGTFITQASKKLSTEDFSCVLDIVAEGIGGSGLVVSHRERLIHLGKAILHDPPQGTLKVIQNFVTLSLNLFVDRDEIYGGSSSLKAQCLEFTAQHCSDRPVAIRPVDLGNIWSFINKTLSGSLEHDSKTTFSIFYHIVTAVGALVRLRRDLVVHTLPHLSLVLRQLMMLTRRIRPQLGAKQSKIVTDTFPSWLSASQPISTDEARALARLLTSLTTKTIPRTHAYGHPSASTESLKAESLAKPFAKHASHVLVAYVDAFNDPLCIINAEMRRELEPGLFALCEMVGEHSRDALMVSTLDSGGKTVMKSLWKDYEKQRYVGKG